MTETTEQDVIRAKDKPDCCLCGTRGKPLYEGLRDRLFGAPGTWNLKRCMNAECGLIWLDPMPVPEDISRAYRHYYTHENESERKARKNNSVFKRLKRAFHDACERGYVALNYRAKNGASKLAKLASFLVYLQPGRKAKVDFRAMYLPVQANGQLLEIGCGSGQQLEYLRKMGWQVQGLDLDPAATTVASARGLTVHVGSLEGQCFSGQCFDAVVSSHVIEHVHDPVALLRESGRILKPGGRIVVVTPNTASWGRRLFGASWRGLEPPRHLHLFDAVSLRQAAEQAGLRVYRLDSSIRDADGMFRASRDIQDEGGHIWGGRHSWSVNYWSKTLQLIEWLMIKINPYHGEELLMICGVDSEYSRRNIG